MIVKKNLLWNSFNQKGEVCFFCIVIEKGLWKPLKTTDMLKNLLLKVRNFEEIVMEACKFYGYASVFPFKLL